MRIKFVASLVSVATCVGGFTVLTATTGPGTDLELINRLDSIVQERFQNPDPDALGMSRIAAPASMGRHFRPDFTKRTDFTPESEAEKELLAELERRQLRVGFYAFGSAIEQSTWEVLDYRALKGPAAITKATPRPFWYPPIAVSEIRALPEPENALPNWIEIYPVALRAMRSFRDGGHELDTALKGWNIRARPVAAASARCVACHQGSPSRVQKEGDLIGGVIYAYRRS